MGLSMKTQVALKIENSEGVAETLTASDLLQGVLAGPSIDDELGEIDRDIARESLTHPDTVPGLRSGRFQFQMELVGPTGFPGAVSPIALPLRSCGMKQQNLRRVTVAAAWTGTALIRDLETFTAAPSGAAGIAWGDYIQGEAYIFVEAAGGTVAAGDTLTFSGGAVVPVHSTFVNQACYGWRPEDVMLSEINVASVANGPIVDGDVLLGGTSAAHAIARASTSGAGAQTLVFERMIGGGHFQASEVISVPGTSKTATVTGAAVETQRQIPSVTLGCYHDNMIKQGLKGARGSWSARLKNGERGILTFDYRGCGVQPTDANLLAWPGTLISAPPVVTGGHFAINEVFFPNFSELTLDMANQVELRESPNDVTGTGYESAHITARRPRGSIDPEVVREVVQPLFGNAWSKTLFKLRARIGTAAGNGNTFEFRARRAQASAPKVNERGRIRAYQYPLLFNGQGDDELLVFEF